MDRKKILRLLRYGVIGLVLLTIVLAVLTSFTLVRGLAGAVSGGGFGISLNRSAPPADWSLVLNATPGNDGILGVRLSVSLGILDSSGIYLARNSSSVYLSPGGRSPLSVVLVIPYELVERYGLDENLQADVVFEMILGIRTLLDVVGLTQTMRIAGDESL